jgi:hypothetical protein
MTAYNLPTINRGSEQWTWGQSGYRDALCNQIGLQILRTKLDEGQLALIFENDAIISLSLRDQDYVGPEALQFRLDNKQIWVA